MFGSVRIWRGLKYTFAAILSRSQFCCSEMRTWFIWAPDDECRIPVMDANQQAYKNIYRIKRLT